MTVDMGLFHLGPGGHIMGIYDVEWDEPCTVCGDIVHRRTEGAYSWFGWVQNEVPGGALCKEHCE